MTDKPAQTHDPLEVLDLARSLGDRGDVLAATALLDATLAQVVLQQPATARLAAQAGWLHLERGHLALVSGALQDADRYGLESLKSFEKADDRAGQAASSLQLGDANWQGGHAQRAHAWWQRACALADAAGNSPLAARALAAIALAELHGGSLAEVAATLDFAEARTAAPLTDAVRDNAGDAAMGPSIVRAAQQQDAAARATVALVRARQAIRVGAHDEARLLLSAAAQHAAETGAHGLQIDALRLDAIVARREADPRAAVESLKLARDVAVGASLAVQAALIDSELVLALADNASWIEAFEVQNREPSAAIAALPPVAAARLESFAVLSRRSQAYEAARAALMEAAAIRRARQDGSGEAANTAQLAELALISGQLEEASQLAERATELGRASGRFDVVVSAGITLLHARVRVGDASADSRTRAAQLSIEAQSVGGVAQQVISLDLHAALLSLSGDIEQAQVVCRQAQSLAESQPLVRLRARTQARSAALLHLRGQHLDAARAAQSAAELARDAEDRTSHAAAMTVAGAALRALGRHDESLLALGHASTEAAMAGRRDLAAQAGFALGDGYRALGHHRQARHCFAIGLQHAEAIADRHLIGDITRGIAACVAAEGNPQAALQTLNRLRAFDDPVLSAVSSTDAARVQLQLGAPKEALVLLSGLDAGVLNDAQRGDMLTVLGHALVASGRVDEAAETLAAAVEAHRGADDHGLGAALFLYGQVQGMRGRGQECGEALGEALVITARLGLPEQHMIRQAIERIHRQAETV